MAPASSTSSQTTESLNNKTIMATAPTSTAPELQSQQQQTQNNEEDWLVGIRYEENVAAKPPIPITVAPPPHAPPEEQHPALRLSLAEKEKDESKRDSGLAPTTSTTGVGTGTGTGTGIEGSAIAAEQSSMGISHTLDSTPAKSQTTTSMPSTLNNSFVKTESLSSGPMSIFKRPMSRRASTPKTPRTPNPPIPTSPEFSPILTTIPTESMIDSEFLKEMSFSKRGSMMFGGKKAVNGGVIRQLAGRRKPSNSMLVKSSHKLLSEEVENESKKVRSMYETGSPLEWEDGKYASMAEFGVDTPGTESTNGSATSRHFSPAPDGIVRPESKLSTMTRTEYELAGGIEDWEDVSGGDVDRYGFIQVRRRLAQGGEVPEPRPPQRISTVLQLASDAPRKKRAFGRSPSTATTRTAYKRSLSRQPSSRSLRTSMSTVSRRSFSRQHLRAAANRLPGYRDRRWMDEAGDMLTLPPGLADIAEENEGGRAAAGMKQKESLRTEKWRKMARMVNTGSDGQGMRFEFNTRSPKLIARTWKGIPDRWRAAAWYSFLSTSAQEKGDCASDEEIIEAFFKFQNQSSADDLQIDIDVPRTINSHIMFRRRYRGGQRLLFRVLHALSLYFPVTGYVQGMASLAATLLCYYDEEKCFVMLVRMWQLRGLQKLYESGFAGLMAALDEFQKSWLNGNDVAQRLDDLGIEPTAYGTRWYLTLFNYSIPFPAQLRVWDVFMLLGDSNPSMPDDPERPFSGGLDVLHAVSAALIDGTREILLDSDFENAMKVLTSWIPVKDEELLMRVTRAEWKLRRGRKHRT